MGRAAQGASAGLPEPDLSLTLLLLAGAACSVLTSHPELLLLAKGRGGAELEESCSELPQPPRSSLPVAEQLCFYLVNMM